MTPERFQQIKNILADALEQPSDSRDSFLLKVCADDVELLQEVRALLTGEMDQDFLDQSPVELNLDDDEIPKQIGRIKIESLIAAGGMGKVYLGLDEKLKRQVAVKVMHVNQMLSAERRTAFLTEAQLLSSLQHPNICQIHDIFSDQDHDVLILEYIKGQTLRDLLKQAPLANPLNIAFQISKALTAAHERGITHRDLKPDNIMVTDNNDIKILDFGLAKSADIKAAQTDTKTALENNEADNATDGNTTVSGTPGYMSPEQAKGIPATTATDLWSFGLIFSELLTGQKAFPSSASTPELLTLARQAEFKIPKTLPRAEKALVKGLSAANPSDRPTARTVMNVIKHIQSRTKRRVLITISALLISTLLFFAWKYTHDLKQEKALAEQARNEAEVLVDYMLNDLYKGLRAVGRTDLLESAAQQALQYYGNLSDEQMRSTQGKPATALIQIAEVFSDQGNKEQAIQTLNIAIEKLSILQDQKPDNDLISYRLADAYLNTAEAMKLTGQFVSTKTYSKAATDIGRRLTTGLTPGLGPEEEPDGTDRWRILLRAIYLNADAHMRLGERTQAIELLEEAVKTAIPATKNNLQLQIELSNIQFKRCGTYYDANILDKLLAPCLATFEIDRQLYEDNPDDYQKLRNLVGASGQMANTYRKLKQLDLALTTAEAGVSLGEEFIKWDPENNSSLNEYVHVLLSLGRAQLELDLLPESQQTFKRTLSIIQPIAADQEEITYMNHHFQTLVLLGRIEEAKSIAKVLKARNFMRRDYQDLCIEFNIEACGINSPAGPTP